MDLTSQIMNNSSNNTFHKSENHTHVIMKNQIFGNHMSPNKITHYLSK